MELCNLRNKEKVKTLSAIYLSWKRMCQTEFLFLGTTLAMSLSPVLNSFIVYVNIFIL